MLGASNQHERTTQLLARADTGGAQHTADAGCGVRDGEQRYGGVRDGGSEMGGLAMRGREWESEMGVRDLVWVAGHTRQIGRKGGK